MWAAGRRFRARGLSREQSKEKNAKAAANQNKGNQEGISATQRAERDAAKLREKQQALAAKRADLDKLRTNPAMANPTLAARMQPKIAEREAEVAALTAEVAALQRAAGS